VRGHVADRRGEEKVDHALKGMRWMLVNDRWKRTPQLQAELEPLVAHVMTKSTVRA